MSDNYAFATDESDPFHVRIFCRLLDEHLEMLYPPIAFHEARTGSRFQGSYDRHTLATREFFHALVLSIDIPQREQHHDHEQNPRHEHNGQDWNIFEYTLNRHPSNPNNQHNLFPTISARRAVLPQTVS